MRLLTLEEQFIHELQELLDFERQLSHQIPAICRSLEELPIEFLRSYLSRKYDQVEALEEILKSLNRDINALPARDSSFAIELDAIISVFNTACGANHSPVIGALQEITEILWNRYKQIASHARILGLKDAEDLLESAYVGEANFSIALTDFEFHHAGAQFENASGG
jgi:ferritin-like metal-binding protein YciE